MRLAAMKLAGKGAAALPVFTSEPEQNLARFGRSFFRDLFSVLPHPCVVVFDNFHEAPTQSERRAAFAQGLEEIPEGITVIVVWRCDPPPEFSRLIASRRIARIDETALRCTTEEAQAIFGKGRLETHDLQRIQRHSDGWVAALVMLREHLSRPGAALDESLGQGKDAIFQYFAGQIFNGARPENQRVLMLTAIPLSITQAEAVALTKNEEAPRLLEYLYRRHLFTDRRRGEETSYHYHALFREFLLDQMRNRVPNDERRAARSQAARLVAQLRQVNEALALFGEAGEWRRCARSSLPMRSIGPGRGALRRCPTGWKRLPPTCAMPIPGSSTGSEGHGYSSSRYAADPHSSVLVRTLCNGLAQAGCDLPDHRAQLRHRHGRERELHPASGARARQSFGLGHPRSWRGLSTASLPGPLGVDSPRFISGCTTSPCR
jgi:hypothetical protein